MTTTPEPPYPLLFDHHGNATARLCRIAGCTSCVSLREVLAYPHIQLSVRRAAEKRLRVLETQRRRGAQ